MFKKLCVKQMSDSTSGGKKNARFLFFCQKETTKFIFPYFCIPAFFGHYQGLTLTTPLFSRSSKSLLFSSPLIIASITWPECDLIFLG